MIFASSEHIFDFYSANVRQGLFTGFLTLASFLFAMKTFIVINMKTQLYDTPGFRKEIAKKRQRRATYPIYGPLKRLNSLLLSTIVLALLTSVLQFSLGLICADWAAVVCLSFAGITVVVLVFSVIQIRLNTSSLISTWEISGNELLEKETQGGSG